jgi:hypothetical protein
MGVRRCRFPALLTKAEGVGLLTGEQAKALRAAHDRRNELQHEGEECGFEEAFKHVTDIIAAVAPLLAPLGVESRREEGVPSR